MAKWIRFHRQASDAAEFGTIVADDAEQRQVTVH